MKKIINNKILIDPGHVGESFFDFRSFTIDNIEFHEGDFCYAWGEIINNYLIELGSECSLSRKKGQPSILINIEDQQKRKHELISTIGEEATLKRFRVPRNFFLKSSIDELLDAAIQNEADLVNRAKSANIKRFDFCLSLHLNGDPNNLRTQKNGICGFTNKISKTHFLLFKNIISNLSKETGLGIIEDYILEEVESGLFIDETLTLLKNIQIPTLIIEGPFQNNLNELLLLDQSLKKFQSESLIIGRLDQLSNAIVSAL